MAKAVHDYIAANLPELRRATFTDETGKTRNIGGDGLALLVWVAGAVDSKTGRFFHTVATIADETGTSLRATTRLLAGFEQLGWFTRTGCEISYKGRGRPSPEYLVTLGGLWQMPTATENEQLTVDQLPVTDTTTAHLGNRRSEQTQQPQRFALVDDSHIPIPTPNPNPTPPSPPTVQTQERSTAAGGGMAKRERERPRETSSRVTLNELLTALVEWERQRFTGNARDPQALAISWRKRWQDPAADALRTLPAADLPTLLAHLTGDEAAQRPEPRPAPRPQQRKCGECGNRSRDTDQHPGLSTVWNPATKRNDICPKCGGTGVEPRTQVA